MSGVFVDVSDLAPGGMRALKLGALDVVVCHAEGAYYALENRCPHAAVPLDAGRLTGCVLECPLHGGRLDVRDGSPLALPIRRPAASFAVRPVPGGIEIDPTARAAGARRSPCTI
jgi:3-phenylpropionate/trans-cinnamate dioxygenase ferredoxin subunit